MYDLVKKKKRIQKKKHELNEKDARMPKLKKVRKSKKSSWYDSNAAMNIAAAKALYKSSKMEFDNVENDFSYTYLSKNPESKLSKIIVGQSEKGWHCTYSSYTTSKKENLKSHIRKNEHNLLDKDLKCKYCQSSFLTKTSLQNHICIAHLNLL